MKRILLTLLFCFVSCAAATHGQQAELVTYQGKLEKGKTQSVIYYLGQETGDLAAFCFPNSSRAGRSILSKCKNGAQCEFTGNVDWAGKCNVRGPLSASARITSVRSVRVRSLKKKEVTKLPAMSFIAGSLTKTFA
jgi:hypothetical protein